jgi:lysophospholipase L1-like esterase
MKKVIKSILSLLLVTSIMAISTAPVMAAETRNHIDYVALGDSCAAGVLFGDSNYPGGGSGLGYTDDIAKMLDNAGVLSSFNKDFAMSGETAAGLATKTDVLNTPDTAQWHLVKDAEVITLDIGANDLLKPLYDSIAGYISSLNNDKKAALGEIAKQMPTDLNGAIQLLIRSGILNKLEVQNLLASIKNAIDQSLAPTGDEKMFEVKCNIETILQNILNANKTADIYVMGYYNPLPALSAYFDTDPNNHYITKINSYIISFNNLIIKKAISNVVAKNKHASLLM